MAPKFIRTLLASSFTLNLVYSVQCKYQTKPMRATCLNPTLKPDQQSTEILQCWLSFGAAARPLHSVQPTDLFEVPSFDVIFNHRLAFI